MPERTPLYEQHVALGARLVDFAGWEMPVQYTGILEEHRACREAAALFDICHMGELIVESDDVRGALNGAMSNDLRRCPDHAARYGFLLNDEGGVIDDLIAFCFNDEKAMIVTNAVNTDRDEAALRERLDGRAVVRDVSAATAKIDLQGPASKEILGRVLDLGEVELKYFRFLETEWQGAPLMVSRTGYTGEYGYELFLPAAKAAAFWTALLSAGAPLGCVPAGLGARDTLRLEAGLPLYGHEMDDSVTPVEMGFERFVSLEKDADFPGRTALDGAPAHRLAGIELLEKGVPREGYNLLRGEETVGRVTSGTLSPTLGRGIAFANLRPDCAAVGTELALAVRSKRLPCRVAETPFYRDGSVRG